MILANSLHIIKTTEQADDDTSVVATNAEALIAGSNGEHLYDYFKITV